MAAISAFGVTQHSQIFSLFFRNRIQCIALYQLRNSQALLNLRRGHYIFTCSAVSTVSSVIYQVRYDQHLECHIFPVLSAGQSCCLSRVNYPLPGYYLHSCTNMFTICSLYVHYIFTIYNIQPGKAAASAG